MKCPTCKDVNLVMTDRQGIEIDYCPDCRGVWLDRGELDKIIERSSTPPTQQRYEERGSEQYPHGSNAPYHKEKRRKSFLGELLDF